MITPDEAVCDLLLRTLQRFVAADAYITHINSIALRGGMSGSAVARHTIQYMTTLGTATISLITKDADLHEYRQALATCGHTISRQTFAERYRVAARYIGLRYMWWTLEYWLEDQTQTPWVQHYINLVTGDGIGASLTMN